MKVTIVLFVPPGICRDCRKSVLESSVSIVAGITSTDMEEGAACATPLVDLESLSRTLGHVTLVWTIILQYIDTVTVSYLVICGCSGTPLYGHSLNTNTLILQTISIVPRKSSYLVHKIELLITNTR